MRAIGLRLLQEKVRAAACLLKNGVYVRGEPMRAEYALTEEPVPYKNRLSLSYCPVAEGDVWSERVFDCAWFHAEGTVPSCGENEEPCLLIDLDGEGCVYDAQGIPVGGLTNVTSDFDRNLGLPGKRCIPLRRLGIARGAFDVWADAGNNDLFGNFCGGTVRQFRTAVCRMDLRALYYDYAVLLDLAEATDEGDPLSRELWYALEKVAVRTHTQLSGEEIAGMRAVLSPHLRRRSREQLLEFYAVGQAHLDLAWLWPIRETKRKAVRTFSTALANAEDYPAAVFGASQPQQYEWVKEAEPALYARIRDAVRTGKIEPNGAMWVEADTNLTGGESLIRQFFYGKKFWQDEFGRDVRTLWLPDAFGFSGALPQIMRGCGCENFLTIKLSWNMVNRFPHNSFRWRGIDGSEVLAHLPPSGSYNSGTNAKTLLSAVKNYTERGTAHSAMLVYGIGDGGGGPGRDHHEFLMREGNLYGVPRVKSAASDVFFRKLSKEKGSLPVYEGELYLERHQGTYTSQIETKQGNRRMELLLSELECAAVLTGKPFDRQAYDALWKETLLYQFHDILPGSSIARVYRENAARYRSMRGQALAAIDGLLREENGYACIFNPTGFARREYLKSGERWIYAEAPPHSIVPIRECRAEHGVVRRKEMSLENAYVRVKFNQNGQICWLEDKRSGRKVLHEGNILKLYRDEGDAWDFYPGYAEAPVLLWEAESAEPFEDGPRSGFEFYYRIHETTMKQRIFLEPDSPRLMFECELDFRGQKQMLRADFRPDISTDRVRCGTQFGDVKRDIRPRTAEAAAQYEICAQRWLDYSEQGCGLTFLCGDVHGFCAEESHLSADLLRSTVHPCNSGDQGSHKICFALWPHEEFSEWEAEREAARLETPLRIVRSEEKRLGVYFSHPSVVVSCVKPAADGNGTIVRAYNSAAQKVRCRFSAEGKGAFLTDLLEKDRGPAKRIFSLRPYEIVTVRVVEKS